MFSERMVQRAKKVPSLKDPSPKDSLEISPQPRRFHWWPTILMATRSLLYPISAYAQQGGSPFDTGFTALESLFTGTAARVASLIAIVIGGYGFAHGEPGAKKVAHTLILGMTGSGKIYFCNFILQNAQKYAPLYHRLRFFERLSSHP